MNPKSNIQVSQKTRRTFLQTMGVSIAGLSVLPPSLFAIDRNFISRKQAHSLNLSENAGLQSDVLLPDGVSAIWDINKAYHETTPTRERICINGLWKWQPGTPESDLIPAENWGYFKVPGNWPGISNYMQKESQRMFAHTAWNDKSLNNLGVAWYHREFVISDNWKNRRIILSADYLNSSAVVFINGERVGEMLFPSCELDLAARCFPGKKYRIKSQPDYLSPFLW